MARASYKDAIWWMAANDDTEWVNDDEPIMSVTATLVADLFDKDHETVIRDLRKQLEKLRG